MSPPKGRDVGQELGLDGQASVFPLSDRFVEMGGIPVNDDGGEEVEPSQAVVLALAGAVADFALASDAEGVLERVVCLAFVQAGVGSALHIGVEQPVDDKERSFDPDDPMGKMFFNILATFAEFEADLIRMRTREGMAIARTKGKLRGKQPKLSDRQQRELCRIHATGEYSISDLAELFSVSRPTVYRTLNRRLSP